MVRRGNKSAALSRDAATGKFGRPAQIERYPPLLSVAPAANLWFIVREFELDGLDAQADQRKRKRTHMMINDNTPVLQKTRELCQTIVEQPEFKAIRQQIDTFMADEGAQSQYQRRLP
jgi:hypothetical protein